MAAQGSLVPISLLELQLVGGGRYFFSDAPLSLVPLLAAYDEDPAPVAFLPLLLTPPSFRFTGTLVQQTSTTTIDNTAGNTVTRDRSLLFSRSDVIFAMWIYRLWWPLQQRAIITALGTVEDGELSGATMELTLADWLNFAKITAPDCQINNNCQNTFGSQQCGSTSTVNCLNSYGNCSQINRFKGLVTEWNTSVTSVSTNSGVAQPPPLVSINPRRPA